MEILTAISKLLDLKRFWYCKPNEAAENFSLLKFTISNFWYLNAFLTKWQHIVSEFMRFLISVIDQTRVGEKTKITELLC